MVETFRVHAFSYTPMAAVKRHQVNGNRTETRTSAAGEAIVMDDIPAVSVISNDSTDGVRISGFIEQNEW